MDRTDIVNLERYPLSLPHESAYQRAVTGAREALQQNGCAVLREFVRPSALARMVSESGELRQKAWFSSSPFSPYPPHRPPPLGEWPPGHPRGASFTRTNRYVAYDNMMSSVTRKLYDWEHLTSFIRDCVGVDELHHSGDPFGACTFSIQESGEAVPWHFDFSPFVVTLLIRAPEEGGRFQYVHNLRSEDDEEYERVAAVMAGDGDRVVDLDLQVGDLQLFEGRYSMHRVTEPRGLRWRCVALYTYREEPNVMGTPEFQKDIFGRIAG